MFTAILIGYTLGCVPFGLLLTRLAGAGDVRLIGSGNIGATNVLRTGNKKLALATLLLDMGKGAAAVALSPPETGMWAMLAAVAGHIWPVWLKFRGGKGVATALGGLMIWSLPLGLVAFICWLVVAGISRISSLAALSAFAVVLLVDQGSSMALWVLVVVLFWTHRANLARLYKGTEPKMMQP
ncbi:MAG: glycerol-3-phosphate 1-O-acyltransferase PlsY [Holosporales bacterium]